LNNLLQSSKKYKTVPGNISIFVKLKGKIEIVSIHIFFKKTPKNSKFGALIRTFPSSDPASSTQQKLHENEVSETVSK